MMMAECSRSFEVLPILENLDILRNIYILQDMVQIQRHHGRKRKKKGSNQMSDPYGSPGRVPGHNR